MLAQLLLALVVSIQVLTSGVERGVDEAIQRVIRMREGAQTTAFLSTESEVAYMGRRFAGKTVLGGAKVLAFGQKYPGARCGIFRSERASMRDSTIPVLRDDVFGRELWNVMYRPSEDMLHLDNGSSIALFGVDDPNRQMGSRWAILFGDQAEQLSFDQFEQVTSSITQPGYNWTQFIGAYNPGDGGEEHWAYRRYRPDLGDGFRDVEGRDLEQGTAGQISQVVIVGEDDFLELLDPAQIDRLDRLTGQWRERLRFGRWVGFSGIVLEMWSPKRHILTARRLAHSAYRIPEAWYAWATPDHKPLPPPSWPRYRGIDFGFNPDPYAVAWVAQSPTGRLYLYRQHMRLQLTLDDQVQHIHDFDRAELEQLRHAAELQDEALGLRSDHTDSIRRQNADWLRDEGLDITTWTDHEAGYRNHYAQNGIPSSPANKAVHEGIETMRTLLDPRGAEGPRFVVVDNSLAERDMLLDSQKRPTCFQEEVTRWLWKTTRTAGGGREMRDVPIDKNDHMVKAVVYCCHSMITRGTVRL